MATKKKGSGHGPDPRVIDLWFCLEVEAQTHLNITRRVELAAHNSKVMRVGEVGAWFERIILAAAKHRMVEGIDELRIEARRKSLCDARGLGHRKVYVPPEEATNSPHAEALVIEGRIPELRRDLRWVPERIGDSSGRAVISKRRCNAGIVMPRRPDGAGLHAKHSRGRSVERRGAELRVAGGVVINEQRKAARGRIHTRDVPSTQYLVGKAAGCPSFALSERQIVGHEQVERVAAVEQRRRISPTDVIRIGYGAGVLLRETEVIKGMSERVVEAEGQTVGRGFPQAEECSMIVGIAFIGVPIDSCDLGIAENHRTRKEARLDQVPQGPSSVSWPVRISVVLIELCCGRGTGSKPNAERGLHHRFEPRLRLEQWIWAPV